MTIDYTLKSATYTGLRGRLWLSSSDLPLPDVPGLLNEALFQREYLRQCAWADRSHTRFVLAGVAPLVGPHDRPGLRERTHDLTVAILDRMRDCDVAGWMDLRKGMVGVVLVDSDEERAQRFAADIESRTRLQSIAATSHAPSGSMLDWQLYPYVGAAESDEAPKVHAN